jgi:hypothetical protein
MSGKSKERPGAFTRSDLILAGSGGYSFKACFIMRFPSAHNILVSLSYLYYDLCAFFVYVSRRHTRVISRGLQIFQQIGSNLNFLSVRRMICSSFHIEAPQF